MSLRFYGEKAGLTQKQLEAPSGVRQVTISKLERGGSVLPTLVVARKIHGALMRSGCSELTIDLLFPPKD